VGEANHKRPSGQLLHYLLTFATTGGGHMHAYLITDDRRYIEHTLSEMLDAAERDGCRVIPMGLCTTLHDDGRETVRNMIARLSPEARNLLNSATDFHKSIWFMPSGHDNERLLALH
jgi:hypothetical protein